MADLDQPSADRVVGAENEGSECSGRRSRCLEAIRDNRGGGRAYHGVIEELERHLGWQVERVGNDPFQVVFTRDSAELIGVDVERWPGSSVATRGLLAGGDI
ncbi:hypothetical protein [Nocardia noduli]|uniref:hypothetical protein n=1 Tax=Nocardia noduli TaxID=2815722 RepID=UPI0020B1CEBA|nr:hypothetical protein [Nocardia noduli]